MFGIMPHIYNLNDFVRDHLELNMIWESLKVQTPEPSDVWRKSTGPLIDDLNATEELRVELDS
jgi:hypothetical protein